MTDQARHAIQNQMFAYAHAIDNGQFERIAELFRHARILGPDGELAAEGEAQVLALYQRSTRLYPPHNTPGTQHITSNIVLNIAADGLHASAESSFTVLQQLPDFPLQTIIAGSYRDRFQCREGEWLFEERQMLPRLYGDLSRHLLTNIDGGR